MLRFISLININVLFCCLFVFFSHLFPFSSIHLLDSYNNLMFISYHIFKRTGEGKPLRGMSGFGAIGD